MLNDLNPKEFRNIYIVCGATDMRCGINGLSAIIEQKYKMNVFIGKTLFMFCGHNAKIMKALLWEGDGFLMLTKRLESGRFTWPRTSTDVRNLSPEQFKWLNVKPKDLGKSADADKKIVAWRCTVCGFVYNDPVLPDDYLCPVCGQPSSDFVPVYE